MASYVAPLIGTAAVQGPTSKPDDDAQAATYNPDGSFVGWVTPGDVISSGVAGGQTLIGGTEQGDSLTLQSNPHELVGRGTLTLDGPNCTLLGSTLTLHNGGQRYHVWLTGLQDHRRANLAIDSWSASSGNATGAADTSLTRESAGRLQIGDGGRNANGGLKISSLNLSGLPTSDPLVEGEVWSDNGTLKISQG